MNIKQFLVFLLCVLFVFNISIPRARAYSGKIKLNYPVDVMNELITSHPRISITSHTVFDQIKDRIDQSSTLQSFYASLKQQADDIILHPHYTYEDANVDETPLKWIRDIYYRITTLLMVNGIEKAKGNSYLQYQNYIIDQLVSTTYGVAYWPSWYPNNFLCPSEMTYAVALAYDWLYHDLTTTQRRDIADAIHYNALLPGHERIQGIKYSA